jgi:hypothetical protein
MKNKNDKKPKPPKRKPASEKEITTWLKKAGHSVSVADKVKSKNDLLKLHGGKDA